MGNRCKSYPTIMAVSKILVLLPLLAVATDPDTCDFEFWRTKYCSSLNKKEDIVKSKTLLMYDPSCQYGGNGCNPHGNDQTCRICSIDGSSNNFPPCPTCVCDHFASEYGFNFLYSCRMQVSNETVAV